MDTVRQLREDQAPEAPGAAFNAWQYCLDLSQSGIGKQIGGAYPTLITLVFHANKQGHAWPSVPTLAREVGCTERAILRDIKALDTYGAIVTKKRPVERGGYGNLYIIVPVVALLSKRPITMRDRLKVHGPVESVTPDNIVTPDRIVMPTPDNIVTPPLTRSSPKRTHKNLTTENLTISSGASAPAAPLTPIQRLVEDAGRLVKWDGVPEPKWKQWAPAASRFIKACTDIDEALACQAWFLSNPWWADKASAYNPAKAHGALADWRSKGRPAVWQERPATKGAPYQQGLPTILTHEQAQATTTAYCRHCRMNAPANHKPTCTSGLSGPVGA